MNSSACAETSGTCRHGVELRSAGDAAQNAPSLATPCCCATEDAEANVAAASMPGTELERCQAGCGQTSESPPPPAPHSAPSFQVVSKTGVAVEWMVVPPTEVTNGCVPGSSTAKVGG